MTRGTRFFLAGSAFVAVLGVGTGLVAYYNGGLPLGLSRGAQTELGYLPADAAAVGYADVQAIMNSEFRQKLRQVLPTGEELSKFRDELGVDIEHDIHTVTAAYLGGNNPGLGNAVVIVRGNFNDVQIETVATRHGAVAESYKNIRVLKFTLPEPASEPLPRLAPGEQMVQAQGAAHPVPAVAFLEPGVLALGESESVRKAIDAGPTGDAIVKNSELSGLINDVRGTGNAWFVARTEALAQHSGLPQEITDHLPAVSLFAASVHVNGGISGQLRAEARDEKAAEQLRDVIRGGLAAGKLVSGENPQANAMLNSLQITGSGKTVGVRFSVPAEVLDLLNGVAAAHQLGTGGAIKK